MTLEAASEGGYFVQIIDLPGCYSQGETVEEAMEMI
jgi:antitoxin HicB